MQGFPRAVIQAVRVSGRGWRHEASYKTIGTNDASEPTQNMADLLVSRGGRFQVNYLLFLKSASAQDGRQNDLFLSK